MALVLNIRISAHNLKWGNMTSRSLDILHYRQGQHHYLEEGTSQYWYQGTLKKHFTSAHLSTNIIINIKRGYLTLVASNGYTWLRETKPSNKLFGQLGNHKSLQNGK